MLASCQETVINEFTASSTGVSHEELVGLAKTHFSGISFEYENDAIPVLSPCRFTGSEVRSRPAESSSRVLHSDVRQQRPLQNLQPKMICSLLKSSRSVCAMTSCHWHTWRSLWRAPAPPALTSYLSWWPTPSSAALTSPTAAERLLKSASMGLRFRNCSQVSPLSFAHLRLSMSLVAINEG